MANFDLLTANLEQLGYTVRCFDTAGQAADYLDSQLDGQTVAFGGSVTLRDMGLYPRLAAHNRCLWHWEQGTLEEARHADVYITSANGVAETGEIINIDGNGNRVASSLFGHKKVYFVIGANKIAPDYDAALWRARNIAAPKNAQRLKKNTPCAALGDRCYNCKSPDRICRALTVFWAKPTANPVEVILIRQELGY